MQAAPAGQTPPQLSSAKQVSGPTHTYPPPEQGNGGNGTVPPPPPPPEVPPPLPGRARAPLASAQVRFDPATAEQEPPPQVESQGALVQFWTHAKGREMLQRRPGQVAATQAQEAPKGPQAPAQSDAEKQGSELRMETPVLARPVHANGEAAAGQEEGSYTQASPGAQAPAQAPVG